MSDTNADGPRKSQEQIRAKIENIRALRHGAYERFRQAEGKIFDEEIERCREECGAYGHIFGTAAIYSWTCRECVVCGSPEPRFAKDDLASLSRLVMVELEAAGMPVAAVTSDYVVEEGLQALEVKATMKAGATSRVSFRMDASTRLRPVDFFADVAGRRLVDYFQYWVYGEGAQLKSGEYMDVDGKKQINAGHVEL